MYHFKSESKVMDDAARASAPGKFIQLQNGITHYELSDTDSAQTVVLIHGYSTPYFIWDMNFASLVSAGFRVLRYDLFGRGYSDHLDVSYNAHLFDRQLLELLDGLRIERPISVVGLSMGAPIAARFAARRPQQVQKLVCIDPVGIPWKRSLKARILEMPLIGEMTLDNNDDRLADDLRSDFFNPERIPDRYIERYMEQLQYIGFKNSLLSSLRNKMFTGAADAFAVIGKTNLPVLLLWGRNDTLIPFENSAQFQKLIPQIELRTFDECGHIPNIEYADEVNALLIKWLSL